MRYLHGFHDPGGEELFLGRPGWITHTVALSSDAIKDYRRWSDQGIGNIVRLNWGYGTTGTIPIPANYDQFAELCARYVQASPGCRRWIIGNEPNHRNEWPQGIKITPQMYAECYLKCRKAIHAVQGDAQVLLAAVAPWNERDAGSWITYFAEMLAAVGRNVDGFAIHAYTHGSDPTLLSSTQKMNGKYSNSHWHFRIYRDWMQQLPDDVRDLPVYITEANQGDKPWLDMNTGYVQALYSEINDWNSIAANPSILCVCLYRWPNIPGDHWGIEGKGQLHQDFRRAVGLGFISPEGLPSVKPESGGSSIPTPPIRLWDTRLTTRGGNVVTPTLTEGKLYWRLAEARFYNEQEADRIGPDHHILVDTVDRNNKRITGVPVIIRWPDGQHVKTSSEKRGEIYSLDFPLTPGEAAFSVRIHEGIPSEEVTGLGMGDVDSEGRFNPGIHTTTFLKFERVYYKDTNMAPSVVIPYLKLVHPVSNPKFRIITQHFGSNPDDYDHFTVDGVALKGHTGMDFGTPVGQPIVAVDAGTAIEVGDEGNKGYGKYIKLSHAWGESLYAHLNQLHVAQGAKVERGQIVAQSGNTGNSTGPHLHFAMRVKPFNRKDGWGGFTNPEPYLTAAEGIYPPLPPAPPLDEGDLVEAVKWAAGKANIPWTLLANLVWAESSFRPNITSSAGAMGLAGIMPATWQEWKVKVGGVNDPFNPSDNLLVAAHYLAWLLKVLDGNRYRALIAYVWGIGNLLADGTAQPPPLVTTYAAKIVHGDDLLRYLEDAE